MQEFMVGMRRVLSSFDAHLIHCAWERDVNDCWTAGDGSLSSVWSTRKQTLSLQLNTDGARHSLLCNNGRVLQCGMFCFNVHRLISTFTKKCG